MTENGEDNFLKPLLSFQGSCDAVNGCRLAYDVHVYTRGHENGFIGSWST